VNPRQLSYELRNGNTPDLNRRRWIIGLTLIGSAMAKIVSLYQTGIIKELPDPPMEIFDSSKVDASTYAYKRFDTPDGLIMLTGYGLTAWLAGAGGQNRARTQPLLPILMGAKILSDCATAVKLASEEWQENKKLCAYCQVATVASFISLALAVPEVVSAVRTLSGENEDRQIEAKIEEVRDRMSALVEG
jgi:uncharacterized membrane protein